jgi:hypothetical protein
VAACQGPRCCLGSDCFDFEEGAAAALWLDWTSVRPPDPNRNADLEVWQDRSGLEHHARPAAGRAPAVGVGPRGGTTPVVRMRYRVETLVVEQPPRSVLRRLGSRDFLVLIAATLPCESSAASQDLCLFQKFEVGPRGFFMRSNGTSKLDGQFAIGGGAVQASLEDAGLACDEFYLFGLRRVVTGGNPELQVRLDGEVVARVDVPAEASGVSEGPLTVGGSGACGNLLGNLAATVALEGPLSDAQTCRLERFLLARMNEAGLAAPKSAPSCP